MFQIIHIFIREYHNKNVNDIIRSWYKFNICTDAIPFQLCDGLYIYNWNIVKSGVKRYKPYQANT
jgi:hypothetical protein